MVRRTSVTETILWQYAGLVQVIWLGFFYLPTVFIYPSFISLAICLTGALASVIIYSMLLSLEDLKRLTGLLSGYLERFSKCEYQQFQIREYIEEDSPIESEVSTLSYSLFGRTLPLNWKRNIRLYVVKKGTSPVLPRQMVAYESIQPSSPSFIFIRDEPIKITSLGRYFIYHELGHASLRNASMRTTSIPGWRAMVIAALCASISLRPSLISFGIFAIYILWLLASRRSYKRWLEESLLFEEMNADRLAARCLSNRSQLDLARYLDSAIRSASASGRNVTQLVALSQYLKKPDNPSKGNYIQEIYSPRIMRFFIASAVFVPIIGALGSRPSAALLLANVALVIIGIVAMMWVLWRKSKLLEKIDGYLSGTTNPISSPPSISESLQPPLSTSTPVSISKSAPSSRQQTPSSSTKILTGLSIGILISIGCWCFMCLFIVARIFGAR